MIKDFDRQAKETIDKVLVIAKLQAFFLGIIIISLYFSSWNFFAFCFRGFFWTGFFLLFLQAIKRLLYSYWSFLFISTLYSLSFVIDFGLGRISLAEMLTLATFIGLNILQASMMMRPIFYPMPNWWEYDFRYRTDIKAKIKVKDKFYDVRIADVRMGEVAIHSFHELEAGDRILLTGIDEIDKTLSIIFDVATVRKNIVGRPHIIGLKLFNHGDIVHYQKLKELIRSKKLSKKHFIRYGQ